MIFYKILKSIFKEIKFYLQRIALPNSVKIEGTVIMHDLPDIRGQGTIVLGGGCVLCSRSLSNSIGVRHPVLLHSYSKSSRISFGENVKVSGCTIFANKSVDIGQGTLIGADCLITDNDHHFLDSSRAVKGLPESKSIIIGENCFIGTRSIILKGVNLGNNCVVAAGAVVTKSFPDNSLIGGNPAKLLRVIE